jgi:hypothetical protein
MKCTSPEMKWVTHFIFSYKSIYGLIKHLLLCNFIELLIVKVNFFEVFDPLWISENIFNLYAKDIVAYLIH